MTKPATLADLEHRLAQAEAALRRSADMEATLRQSEELRRIAVEGGRMGTWCWDLRDEVIWGDAAFLRPWGYPASDEPRRLSDFTDRMSPQGRAEMGEMVTRAVLAGEEFDGQLVVLDGPTVGHWVRWRGRAERERPWIVNGVSFDVTEQRRKDERLRESEARHRFLVESWAQAVWETDAVGVVTTDSPSWRAYTGQTLAEWLGYGWLDAIHPDDRAYAERQWREAIAACGLVDAEFRLRTPNGGWRWTNVRAAPVLDEEGRIAKWAGMNIDIEARRSTQTRLQESEARLAAIIESLPVGVGVTDSAGRFLIVNDAMQRFVPTGIMPSKDEERLSRWRVVEPDGRGVEPRDFPGARALRGERVVPGMEMLYTDDGGRDIWTSVATVPIHDADGRVTGHASVVNDIDIAKRMEKRQSFLLELSDTLRSLADADAIQGETCRLLAEHLETDRAYYVEVNEAAGTASVERDFVRNGSPSLAGRHPVSSFSWSVDILRRGECHVIADTRTSPLVPEADRPGCAALEIIGCMGAPLIKRGQLVGALCVTVENPRDWKGDEFRLLREVGERVWSAMERARAEAALRTSEVQLQVMVTELQHRTRNLIGVVEAIALRTMDETGPGVAFLHAYSNRLLALSRVQGLLSQVGEERVTIREVIEMELHALGAVVSGDRVQIEGPDVALRKSAVQTMALAIHELATNAHKYGALSNGAGELSVRWTTYRQEGKERRLLLEWIECGVAVKLADGVVMTQGGGYGRELIEKALPYALKARTRYELGADGLRCTIDLPLDKVARRHVSIAGEPDALGPSIIR